jgi:hypothetical protein|tara:strand:+ start:76 stop:261 length:186 start_codon:yes stop_codon:yes gene_type:complete
LGGWRGGWVLIENARGARVSRLSNQSAAEQDSAQSLLAVFWLRCAAATLSRPVKIPESDSV